MLYINGLQIEALLSIIEKLAVLAHAHLHTTIFGGTVGYPSDSVASCYLGHVKKFLCNVM